MYRQLNFQEKNLQEIYEISGRVVSKTTEWLQIHDALTKNLTIPVSMVRKIVFPCWVRDAGGTKGTAAAENRRPPGPWVGLAPLWYEGITKSMFVGYIIAVMKRIKERWKGDATKKEVDKSISICSPRAGWLVKQEQKYKKVIYTLYPPPVAREEIPCQYPWNPGAPWECRRRIGLPAGPDDLLEYAFGDEEFTWIRGSWIVLSEWRRPGSWACTLNKLESGDDAPEPMVLRMTSSTEIEVRLFSSRKHGGRWGYPIGESPPRTSWMLTKLLDIKNDLPYSCRVLTQKRRLRPWKAFQAWVCSSGSSRRARAFLARDQRERRTEIPRKRIRKKKEGE